MRFRYLLCSWSQPLLCSPVQNPFRAPTVFMNRALVFPGIEVSLARGPPSYLDPPPAVRIEGKKYRRRREGPPRHLSSQICELRSSEDNVRTFSPSDVGHMRGGDCTRSFQGVDRSKCNRRGSERLGLSTRTFPAKAQRLVSLRGNTASGRWHAKNDLLLDIR